MHHGCEITAVHTLSPSDPPGSEAPSQTNACLAGQAHRITPAGCEPSEPQQAATPADGGAARDEALHQKRKREAAHGDSWPLEVEFSDGRRLGADLVISAIGVSPNTSWLPKEVPTAIGDGGILVNR